jgi:hypothetical protein
MSAVDIFHGFLWGTVVLLDDNIPTCACAARRAAPDVTMAMRRAAVVASRRWLAPAASHSGYGGGRSTGGTGAIAAVGGPFSHTHNSRFWASAAGSKGDDDDEDEQEKNAAEAAESAARQYANEAALEAATAEAARAAAAAAEAPSDTSTAAAAPDDAIPSASNAHDTGEAPTRTTFVSGGFFGAMGAVGPGTYFSSRARQAL